MYATGTYKQKSSPLFSAACLLPHFFISFHLLNFLPAPTTQDNNWYEAEGCELNYVY
jgi:hypothetical protein